MPKVTPQEFGQKWAQRLGAATTAIQQGVQRVNESPTAKAATPQATDAYLRGVQESVTSGKRQAALQRSTLEDWKSATLSKGVARVGSGAQAAIPKMVSFANTFLPHVYSVAERVHAMPKGGIENGIARAVAQIRGNAEYRR